MNYWKEIMDKYLELKEQKIEAEKFIFKELRSRHWKDYKYGKVHASIVESIKESIDESELPLLLSKSDIEKLTRRKTVQRLVIVTDDMRKAYNKKLKGEK